MHLYIHIPFCHRICPYCAFYKHTPGNTDLRAFVEALITESKMRIPQGYQPQTLFFGGGTPSMLSPTHFDRLMKGLSEHIDFSALKEFSLEANPATFNLKKAQLWQSWGVNRVSLGVQSFSERALKLLGREHSPAMAQESVALLRQAGIAQVNIDLMFSLPGQTREEWLHSLKTALELNPNHISTYNLTYEEDTDFFRQYGADATLEEEDVAMFCMADEIFTAAGYRHYEVSNYAKENCESLHNIAYWEGRDYYGIGPGAFGTINGVRYENEGDTRAYNAALAQGELPPSQEEKLSPEDKQTELVGLRLRMDTGLPRDLIPAGNEQNIEHLCAEGLCYHSPQQSLCLTQRGRLLVDEIAVSLLS